MKSTILMLAISVAASAVLIAALAVAAEDRASPAPAQAPSNDEELRREAERATGKPGEIPPVCPREEVVAKLKERGSAFGPCVPIDDDASDQERRALLEKAAKANYGAAGEAEGKPDGSCTAFSARTDDGEIEGSLPCDERVLDDRSVTRNGRSCVELKVGSKTDPSQPARTRTFCAEG